MHTQEVSNLVERAWVAGFFEGEGCICITKDFTLCVRAAQIDREPLEKLRGLFGGKIRNKCVHGNRKPCHEWGIYNTTATHLLRAIQEFVVRPRVTKPASSWRWISTK